MHGQTSMPGQSVAPDRRWHSHCRTCRLLPLVHHYRTSRMWHWPTWCGMLQPQLSLYMHLQQHTHSSDRLQGLEDISKLSLVHQAVSLNLSVSD